MSRALKTTIAILAVLVVLGLITLPSLRRAIQRISGSSRTEEQARREVMQIPISTPTDVKITAQMYWLSAASPTALEASAIELPLSADPVERSKQLLLALIANAPAPERRTLPPDATLLAFYIQPDGTAIADFSDALQEETPSGILSEQMAVDSIAQTLGANVNAIRQLKILIHGQEAETLAGHLDLSGLFPVPSAAQAATPASQAPTTPHNWHRPNQTSRAGPGTSISSKTSSELIFKTLDSGPHPDNPAHQVLAFTIRKLSTVLGDLSRATNSIGCVPETRIGADR